MTLLAQTEALARGAKALQDRATVTRGDGISKGRFADRQKEALEDEEAAKILAKLASDPRLIDASFREWHEQQSSRDSAFFIPSSSSISGETSR